jgi:hypothetical protein
LAKALSTDNMLDLLKIVGDVDDFVALRNETINKNVMLDFSGNIIGRNKEEMSFLAN